MMRTHKNHFVEVPMRADQLDQLAEQGWRLIGFSSCPLPEAGLRRPVMGWLYVFVRERGA